jgi:hypothetical protein
MGLFSRKKSDEEMIKANLEAQQAEIEDKSAGKKSESDIGDSKIGIEVTKIQAQLEGMNEFRKATNERFTRNSEELGEIKGMVVETNKSVSRLEAASTRAIDLVETVKPDQLMIEVRKQDSKAEALKANIETNETMMRDMMRELKEMRQKMEFYKGVEQVAKMNEEIKKELIEVKKVEAVIDRHSNKIESIYLEVEKKFTDFDKYGDVAKDLQKAMSKIQEDIDKLRVRVEDKADKKELLNLISRFGEFEKHTTNIINLLDERSKSLSSDVNNRLDREIMKFRQATKEIAKTEASRPKETAAGKADDAPVVADIKDNKSSEQVVMPAEDAPAKKKSLFGSILKK